MSVREATGALYSLDDVLEETKADAKLVRELEEYGVVKGEQRAGMRYFDETERDIIGAVAELARYGVGGRNLRVFRSSADREANLLQQILAPALRSRNPQRRKEALEALDNLAAVATHLKHCCSSATCVRSPADASRGRGLEAQTAMPNASAVRTIAASAQELWEVINDPHHLPRWWPRVTRVEGVEDGAFTEVMKTRKGKLVRADFQLIESDEDTRRIRWEQQVRGTPFERVLKSAETEVTPPGEHSALPDPG